MKRSTQLILSILFVFNIVTFSGCNKNDIERTEDLQSPVIHLDYGSETSTEEKGYNLPIDRNELEESEKECLNVMHTIKTIYKEIRGENPLTEEIEESGIKQIQLNIKEMGFAVISNESSTNMSNYENVDMFLAKAKRQEKGNVTIYIVHSNGGITRNKFIYDGQDMYVLETIGSWNDNAVPTISWTSYTRINNWYYTEKGWFCYEYCVPEPPEVSEVVNGNAMIRVKPLPDEYKTIAANYLYPIGYMGNNLFLCNWDQKNLKALDLNALYEYFYSIQHNSTSEPIEFLTGIPKEEFEDIMIDFLPISTKDLMNYARFDRKTDTYRWTRLGCGNYAPNLFGTSRPEIVDLKENADGTTTLKVDVVCEMLGNDAVFTHELTVRFKKDGIQYLSNKILNGEDNIPQYQYRVQ